MFSTSSMKQFFQQKRSVFRPHICQSLCGIKYVDVVSIPPIAFVSIQSSSKTTVTARQYRKVLRPGYDVGF